MKRTIGYIRVSTAEQAEHGHSLGAQEAKLRTYVALYGLELLRIEIDAGESAATLERPALKRALADLRRGRADALLVVKLDRLTRSVRDLEDLLGGVFKKRALLSVEDHVDTTTASGRLVLGLLTQVGQWEREAIGERTAAVRRRLRAQGRYVGGSAPFGWKLDGERLVQDPAEQEQVARALELRAAGLTVRGVAEMMGWSAGRAQRVLAYARG